MLLEVNNLHVYYGHIHAIKGISLQVDKGEIVTLIGANGAGKSTTLKTISGLLHPREGGVKLEGQPIDKIPPHEIAAMGIAHVPEGRQLFYGMSVQDNLEVGAYLLKTKKEFQKNLDNLCEHFPAVRTRIKHRASDLSGGEQQMVAVCRALMSNPKVLLMDEPSLGLSPIMVQEVAKIVTQINQTGVTIILVEQNARMALELANKAYVMEVGSITMHGDAKTIAQDENVIKAYLGG